MQGQSRAKPAGGVKLRCYASFIRMHFHVMARTRSKSAPRLNRDAQHLVALAKALSRSGSRVEDIYWETQLEERLSKLLHASQDAALEAALDVLAQTDVPAYEVLIEQAETHSESMRIEKDGQKYDLLLVVAPIVAWTRYNIPTGPLSDSVQNSVLQHLRNHILAQDTRIALLPRLVSIDQMPLTFSQTWHCLHRLGSQALGLESTSVEPKTDAESASLLADTRYLICAVAVPQHQAVFRWQTQVDDDTQDRDACTVAWTNSMQATLAALLPGCGFESLLPDAYYVNNREADRRVRPLAVRAAVHWLEGAAGIEASELRAVVAGCGETAIDEYRVGFTARNSNDVIYGCIWPLYGREESVGLSGDMDLPDVVDDIAALLKECGVTELRRIPGMLPLEFCEDCGAPTFPNPHGELVHAEIPEEAHNAPTQFH